jgi:hypothetical protein
MTEQKKLRMDEAGPRLARIVKELRALQEQEKKLIEELAGLTTAALGWSWLAEANGVKLPDDEDKDTS